MNLKNTIDNTNKYKNDLKLAKQKINDRILSGGGEQSKTLNEMPNNIQNMIKNNYKKVAMGEFNKIQSFKMYSEFTLSVPVSFKMSRCIVRAIISGNENKNFDNSFMMDTKTIGSKNKVFGGISFAWNGEFELGTDNKIHIVVNDVWDNSNPNIKLLDWIAIE